MRKILAILFVFISLNLAGQTTWYISPSGSDASGDGSQGNPWRTLYKAANDPEVSEGDIIFAVAGTHYITTQVLLPDGVSITGEGMYRTIFNCSVSNAPAIKAESYGHSGDTNYGNQSISYCGFQGNMTGYQAIAINFRSNVEIHHCNFENFAMDGVIFFGQPKELWTGTNPYEPWKKMPSAWCSGNKFYNNIMTNNATYTAYEGRGNLRYGQQNGFECYNNTITQTARAAGSNGYGIKFYEEGWNQNTDMHDNVITVAPREYGKFNFSIENWNDMGGCEYYNNTLQGQIDFTYTFDLIDAGYGSWFHNNIVGFSSTPTNTEVGVTPEAGWVDKCIISNNIFRNLTDAIIVQHIYPIAGEHPNPGVINNVQIYNNLIYNIGETSTGSRWTYGSIGAIAIEDYQYNSGNMTDSVFIQNNTIVSSGIVRSNTYMSVGILIAGNQTFSNVRIRNNIIKGFTGAGMINAAIAAYGTQTNTNFLIQNNDFYGNGNNNFPLWDDLHGGQFSTGYGYSYTNNIQTDPLFTSSTDYRLMATSGAIGTGQYVGIATDYLGNAYNNPPSMGCYEYVTGFTVPIVVTSDITDITTSTATGGGNVTNSGGTTVTARGVCWSTSINPVVSGSHTSDGTGTGSFTSSITGLTTGTTYYVRAYATNSIGTAYGLNRTFTASTNPVVVTVGVRLLKGPNGRLLIRNNKPLKRQ